jgi:hypothetical protein
MKIKKFFFETNIIMYTPMFTYVHLGLSIVN